MTVMLAGLGLLIFVAAFVSTWPRVGQCLAAGYTILVIAVLIWSAITGDLMRPTGREAVVEEGCGYLRVC